MLLPALAAVIVSGCRVGPEYKRPDLAPPATYRGAPAAAAAESLADVPWWQVFDDPALQGLLRDAIANNPDLRLAVARVSEARALAGVAKSFLYPDINLNAGYTGNQASRNSQPPGALQERDRTFNNTAVSANMAWEIDLFGRLRSENDAAFNRYLATEEGRRAVLVTLVSDVATSYFLLRESDLQLEVARRTLELNDRTVTYYGDRLQGGVSNRLELNQARANRALTASSIPELERQIAIIEHAISVLAGRAPGAITRGRSVTEQAPPPMVPVGVPAALLERRPDVLEAERLLISANADIGAAKALFYPRISLTGSLGTVSGDLADFLKGDSIIWSFGAGLFQPLFNAGRIRRNLEAAEARFEQAIAIYQRSALNAYREVVRRTGHHREARVDPRRAGDGCRRPARRRRPVAVALRDGALLVPGSADRRSAAVPAGTAAGQHARRAVSRHRAALSRARRRMAGRTADAAAAGQPGRPAAATTGRASDALRTVATFDIPQVGPALRPSRRSLG